VFETYRSDVGATFTVHLTADEHVPLVLNEVRALPAGGPRDQPFALDFSGVGRALPQGTYVFENPAGTRTEIFIVPVGSADDGRMRYEAVFN
jgi:hypothetical protein